MSDEVPTNAGWPWWAIPAPMKDPHDTPEDENTFVVELDYVKFFVGAIDLPLEQCRRSAWKIHNAIMYRLRDGVDLQKQEIRRLEAKLHECIPCQSCGADPRICPPSGGELPIVKGALDEQAEAEKRAAEAERRTRQSEIHVESLRGRLRTLQNELQIERLTSEALSQQLLDVQQDCIAAEKCLADRGMAGPVTEDSIRREERRRAEAEIAALIREHARPEKGSSSSRINPDNGEELANLVEHSDYKKGPR